MRKIAKKIMPAAAWIIIWQLVAILIHNKILLAGPLDTAAALMKMSTTPLFWGSIGQTVSRILIGFSLGVILGLLFAYISYIKPGFERFLKPLVTALKSVPVASFVILLLIWFGSRNISVIICTMVVFPILYLNTIEGLKSTDMKMLEMASVFRIPAGRKIRYIFLPQLKPFFKSSCKLAIGMSFKSGIAAEVIGQPLGTIGNGLYLAKIYMETGELFAWTIVVVLISFLCEKVIVKLIKLM